MSFSQEGLVPNPMKPGLAPPSGLSPTFHEAYTLRPYMTLEIAACVALTTVLLAGRAYTKLILIKHVSWEDCMYCQIYALI